MIQDRIVKVIGLNTEVCDIENHYIYGVLKDPLGQIDFLINELQYLEKNNGLAIIVGHITPDDGCNHEFSVRLKAIFERYQNIIRMNMYAHSHTDSFKLFMSYTKPTAPVGIMHVCGSVTTWVGNNPGFCVYEVDAETLLPLKRTTYAFNMETANTKGDITWTAYTNFIKDYALPDLSPNSFLNLATKIKS